MNNRIVFRHTMAFKISMITIMLLLLLTGTMLYRSHLERLEVISIYEDHLNEIAEATIHRRFRVSYEILNTGLSQVLANPLIVEAFKDRDREELYHQISPSFESFREASICRFHFHLPEGTSFLKAQRPEDYGADLTQSRPMVNAVVSAPENGGYTGMEHGVSGVALRSIAPIYHEGIFIGSVELGMCLESRIINIFKNVSGGEWFLYSLNNKESELLYGTSDQPSFPSPLTSWEYQQLLSGETLIDLNSPYVIQRVPIQNFEGRYSHYFKREFDNSELIALQSRYTMNSFIFAAGLSIAGLTLLCFFLTRLLRPLKYLEQKARNFEKGTLIEPIEVQTKDEIGVLAKAMETMRQSLITRESALKEMSYKDQLTDSYNRHYFQLALKQFDEKKAYPISIIIGDMDDLKEINDTLGHSMGDKHIQKASRILQQEIRSSDVLCRLGGDEFGILLPEAPLSIAEEVVERIQNKITRENRLTNGPHLHISFGHSTCESSSDSLQGKIELADQAMYLQKAEKKKGK